MDPEEEPKSLSDHIKWAFIEPFKQHPLYFALFWVTGILFFVNIALVGVWGEIIDGEVSLVSPIGIIALISVVTMVVSFVLAYRISPYNKSK